MDESKKSSRPSRLRILVFTHYYWPEVFRINHLVEDLIREGAEVTVLTGFPSYPGGKVFPGYSPWRPRRERHPTGYEILRVPVVPRGSGSGVSLAFNYLSFVVTGVLVGSWLLRGKRFDVLFNFCTTPAIQGFIGVWLRLTNGGKLVLWVQDLWPQALASTGFVRSPGLLWLVGKVVSILYRSSDLVLGQSRAFVRFIRPVAGGTPVEFFPNPGEREVPPTSVGYLQLSGRFNVVFAGNLGKAQALETVVDAAEMLQHDPDFHFTLVGTGSMSEWIAHAIDRRGIANLTLPGRVPPEAMPAIYAQASALLLTLVDDELLAQTVPTKLQSYLAAGIPVIAAVNGEAAEIVAESGGGLPCRAGDPVALADALGRLKAMSEGEQSAMGEAGRRYFEQNYRPERLARELFDRLRAVSRDDGSVIARHASDGRE